MRLVIDESVDWPIVAWLRECGHDVWAVAEQTPGLTDGRVLDTAWREDRVLVTNDKDFGSLVWQQQRPAHGVLLLRLGTELPVDCLKRLQAAWTQIESSLGGNFVVLTDRHVRVRALPSRK